MASPIGHSAVALLVWPTLRRRGLGQRPPTARWGFGAVLLFALCWPDLDFLPHLLRGERDFTMHLHWTHTLLAGVVMAAVLTWPAQRLGRLGVTYTFLLLTAAGWSQCLIDGLTWQSRGVMFFWPLSETRFNSVVPLFYGARHSQPEAWPLHAITLGTELAFAAVMWWCGRRLARRR